MIEDEPESKFTLRVWFMTFFAEPCPVKLTPSGMLPGESIKVNREELPDYIMQPIALLKMLPDGGRIAYVGKRVNQDLFYVGVRVEDWLQYTDDKTKEK